MPFRTRILRTALAPHEVERRIAALVGPRRRFWDHFRGAVPGEPPFEGTAGPGRFEMTRRIHYRNSFLPRVRAQVEPDPSGARVVVRMALRPLVAVFVLVWLGAVAAAFLTLFVAKRSDSALPALMLAFGVALTAGGFHFEARKAERLLREAIQAFP